MSSSKTPSMIALVGLLAVAGYQNRGKISEMLNADRDKAAGESGFGGATQPTGLLAEITSIFGGATAGASLSEAVSGLVDRFRSSGQAKIADSWISSGENRQVDHDDLAISLGDGIIDELALKTGLSRSDLLSRLAQALPEAVNAMTPDGRVPSADEARAHI